MAETVQLLEIGNAEAVCSADIPRVTAAEFRESVIDAVRIGGASIASLFGQAQSGGLVKLIAVLEYPTRGTLCLVSTDVKYEYPAITPDCPQAHWFEREIAEQWGIRPQGHPWLKPLRFHASYRPGIDAWDRKPGQPIRPGVVDTFQVHGPEVHEVAVGPVHAGIIEPGHFRFQCYGEEVFHLEISLGYQHRGIEKALIGGPDKRTLLYMETASGDTTVGHATAYCQAVEALCDGNVPARAQSLRAIGLELERMANHVGDLGALSGDVAYLPTMSYCGRIRGDILNMTAQLCGNRFGRGLLQPGGVSFDADGPRVGDLLKRLDVAARDLEVAVNLLWNTASVTARFEETGVLTETLARQIGMVGPAARACGISRDVRQDLPFGMYRFSQIPASTWHSGDVFARAYVRWLEIQRSMGFVREQLQCLPKGETLAHLENMAPNQIVVSLTEGWRGEICHVAMTDKQGQFAHYKIVDPSFHNWFGLAYALRNQQVSDFPLCNKSFNLSYCGHDL
jgi:Ni,Fe-hydrogenase III large subunit